MFFAPAGEYRPQVKNFTAQLDSKTSVIPLGYDAKNFRPAYFEAEFDFRPGKTYGPVLETGENAPRLAYDDGGLYAELPFYSPAKGSGVIKTPACPIVAGRKHGIKFYAGLRDFSLEADGKPCASAQVDFLELPVSRLSVSPDCSGVKTQLGVFRKASFLSKIFYFARPLLWLAVFAALAGLIVFSGFGAGGQIAAWGGYALLFFWGLSSDFTFLLPVLQGTYYDLTQAFLHGQLSLLYVPPPEMLALPDPYQFSTVGQFKAWDLSLYNGKFFLYFGPVPALMRLLSFGLAGQAAAIVFYAAACVFLFCLTLATARKMFFPQAGGGVLALIFACAALSPLGLYLVSAYSLHVEAVIASSAFLMGGVYFFLRALTASGNSAAFLAGVCFALAVGSRQSNALAVFPFAAYYLYSRRKQWRAMLAFVAPLAVAAALLLIYNYLRFGKPLEFGLSLQLSGARRYMEAGRFFSGDYVLDNLRRYLLWLPRLSVRPPFLLPPQSCWEPYHPVWSVFLLMPLSVLAFAGLWRLRALAGSVRALFILCVAAGMLPLLLLSSNVGYATRFESDFAWLFALAGGLACLSLAEISSRAAKICGAVLVLFVLCGLYIAFSLRIYNWLEYAPAKVFDCWLLFA